MSWLCAEPTICRNGHNATANEIVEPAVFSRLLDDYSQKNMRRIFVADTSDTALSAGFQRCVVCDRHCAGARGDVQYL